MGVVNMSTPVVKEIREILLVIIPEWVTYWRGKAVPQIKVCCKDKFRFLVHTASGITINTFFSVLFCIFHIRKLTSITFVIRKIKNVCWFSYLFLAVMDLNCCTWAFSSCSEQRLLSGCGVWASYRSGFSWQSRGSRAQASVVVALGLRCPKACGGLLDQESNPCSLHWQADS